MKKPLYTLVFLVLFVLTLSGCGSAPVIQTCTPDNSSFTTESGQQTTFSVTATDPKGAPLTYEWIFTDGSTSGDIDGPSITWKAPSQACTVQASVTVSNGTKSVSHTWTITVQYVAPPSVPSGLLASGSLGKISLNWTASTGGNLKEYWVYRSTDSAVFTKIATVSAPATTYEDTGVEDGVEYVYQVTAVGDAESEPSAPADSMHGTRITGSTADFSTIPIESPYVIETNVNFVGTLTVSANTKLYIRKGVIVNFTKATNAGLFYISRGLVAARGTRSDPVTITATGMGVHLNFVAPADGTIFDHVQVNNMKSAFGDTVPFTISGSLTMVNCRFEAPDGSAIQLSDSGALISHCYFSNLGLKFNFPQQSTMHIDSNIFMAGKPAIQLINSGTWLLQPGQLTYNAIQCSGTNTTSWYAADFSSWATAAGTIPLGQNFYFRGTSYDDALTASTQFYVNYGSPTSSNFDFSGILTARPANIGPDWGTNPF